MKASPYDSLFFGRFLITIFHERQHANHSSIDTVYQSELYRYTAKIIAQGQKESSMVTGSPMKLADYYWGVVYLYALKKLFTTEYEMLGSEDLERTVLKCQEK